jgi:hypothetical protein
MSYLTRAAALAARALQNQGSAASRSAVGQNVQQVRAMGGHAAHSNPNDYVTYAGLTLKKPPTWEYAASKLIGGTMWFYIFVQLYNNWDVKTKGLPAVFEAEGLDEDDHHGHH